MQLADLWIPAVGFGANQIAAYGPCPDCNGLGGRITEQGKVLARFFTIVKDKGPF